MWRHGCLCTTPPFFSVGLVWGRESGTSSVSERGGGQADPQRPAFSLNVVSQVDSLFFQNPVSFYPVPFRGLKRCSFSPSAILPPLSVLVPRLNGNEIKIRELVEDPSGFQDPGIRRAPPPPSIPFHISFAKKNNLIKNPLFLPLFPVEGFPKEAFPSLPPR